MPFCVLLVQAVGTRSNIQCLEKWYDQLSPSMVARGEWGSGDDRRMLRALYRRWGAGGCAGLDGVWAGHCWKGGVWRAQCESSPAWDGGPDASRCMSHLAKAQEVFCASSGCGLRMLQRRGMHQQCLIILWPLNLACLPACLPLPACSGAAHEYEVDWSQVVRGRTAQQVCGWVTARASS